MGTRRDSPEGSKPHPALAGQIADRFGLGKVTAPMRSVSRPDEMGRRWVLETGRGRWAPRTVDDVFPVTDGEDNTRFQEAAARAGVTLPRPVRSVTGAAVEVIGGHQWRVYEWLASGPPAGRTGERDHHPGGRREPGHHPGASVPRRRYLSVELHADWSPVFAAAVPTLVALESFQDDAPAEAVLCHNNLSPGNVRIGRGGRLVVSGWEHANGLPPAWELCSALVNWAVNPGGGVSAAGARALVEGYQARAGSLPRLSLDTFHGAATALQNYVAGQVATALNASGGEDQRYADRNIRHLLTHLPSRATYERLLVAVAAPDRGFNNVEF